MEINQKRFFHLGALFSHSLFLLVGIAIMVLGPKSSSDAHPIFQWFETLAFQFNVIKVLMIGTTLSSLAGIGLGLWYKRYDVVNSYGLILLLLLGLMSLAMILA